MGWVAYFWPKKRYWHWRHDSRQNTNASLNEDVTFRQKDILKSCFRQILGISINFLPAKNLRNPTRIWPAKAFFPELVVRFWSLYPCDLTSLCDVVAWHLWNLTSLLCIDVNNWEKQIWRHIFQLRNLNSIWLQIFWSAAVRAAGSSKKICNNTEKLR